MAYVYLYFFASNQPIIIQWFSVCCKREPIACGRFDLFGVIFFVAMIGPAEVTFYADRTYVVAIGKIDYLIGISAYICKWAVGCICCYTYLIEAHQVIVEAFPETN